MSNETLGKPTADYQTVTANALLEGDLRSLVRLSIAEDLRDSLDWTTVCLIEPEQRGGCHIVPREKGICAGLATLEWIVDEFDADLDLEITLSDGQLLIPGEPIATLQGSVRDLLTSERTILNILSRLCGIASLTASYVAAIGDSPARLYDTRKTTPGWRLLEKYAVHCGGAHNHRSGLYDGFLIKDNHLALAGGTKGPITASAATQRALRWQGSKVEHLSAPTIVEIEVDCLEQFQEVLPTKPDIILLDNFPIAQLCKAVALRDEMKSPVELEASGNVRIDTLPEIAATGVDRISSGALTHQATSLDLGLDWFDSGEG